MEAGHRREGGGGHAEAQLVHIAHQGTRPPRCGLSVPRVVSRMELADPPVPGSQHCGLGLEDVKAPVPHAKTHRSHYPGLGGMPPIGGQKVYDHDAVQDAGPSPLRLSPEHGHHLAAPVEVAVTHPGHAQAGLADEVAPLLIPLHAPPVHVQASLMALPYYLFLHLLVVQEVPYLAGIPQVTCQVLFGGVIEVSAGGDHGGAATPYGPLAG